MVNPEKDTTIKGFITGDSYFVVNVAVEVPLNGSVNQLVVTDTLEIDLDDFESVQSAEFKSITSNDFPADMRIQVFFLDENGNSIDQLFNGEGFDLEAAPVQEMVRHCRASKRLTLFHLIRKGLKKSKNQKNRTRR